MTKVFNNTKKQINNYKSADKIVEEYKNLQTTGSQNVIKIYDTKQKIKSIINNINEESFISLLEMIESNDYIIQSCINERFILEYLKYMFDFSNKQYYKKNYCAIRYKHWIYKFNADGTVDAYNDFRNIEYKYPVDIINERTSTYEYKFLYYGRKYFEHKIKLSVYLRKIKPDEKYINTLFWFLKNLKIYNKKFFEQEFIRYNQDTDNMIVKAKVNLEDLKIQKKDFKISSEYIHKILPHFKFIIDNKSFSEKII